jgi:hypothetical protein
MAAPRGARLRPCCHALLCAPCAAELVRLFMLSFVYSTVAHLMWQPVMQFGQFFALHLATFLCMDGVGVVTGILVPLTSSRLIALILGVLCSILNGFPGVPVIPPGFFSYWFTVVLQAEEMKPSADIWDISALQQGFEAFPSEPVNLIPLGVGIIVVWIVGLKLLTFVSLWWVARA